MNFQALFAYGTLMTEEPNHRIVENNVVAHCSAFASGQMYHVWSTSRARPVYPVVDFDEAGLVWGELLLLPTGDRHYQAWEYVRFIEIGSGYQERRITCLTTSGLEVEALAYHWPLGDRGPRIASGDWKEELKWSQESASRS